MLQVESDVSFLFLAADSSAAQTEKTSSLPSSSSSSSTLPGSTHMNNSNQWQPPAWHHHHARHVPPPSTAAAHLPAPFALPSPRTNARSIDSAPSSHQQHAQPSDDQRYGASYANDFAGYGYHEQQREQYYAAESQWSYPADNHAQQHHQNSNQQHGVLYGKPSMGLAIDPLPLRHLVVPPTAANGGNGGGSVDDELYEAHMLQEALTTPHYTRAHLGGFHHPHQLPAHMQQSHHQQQHPHHLPTSQYSSPFVSAVLDASAPMHHHNSSSLGGLHMVRPPSSAVTTPSEHTAPSDSDIASGSDLKSSSASKRKRRGESAPRLCRVEGCNKGIRSRGLCKAHGGGRRCMTPGCTTSDQGGGHCVLHGGGRRCTVENCTKSAQWKGLCKMHGGARRCRYPNCTKNGQVKAGYCRAHHNLITKQREQGVVDA